VLTQRRTLIDIAPTIGRLLNFDTPLAEGEVMEELFDTTTPTPSGLRFEPNTVVGKPKRRAGTWS
jgi:hypothetical protein